MEKILTQIEEICTIDSRTSERTGVEQVQHLVAHWLCELGCSCQFANTEAPTLCASIGKGSKPVVLLAHADTVLSPAQVPVRFEKQRILGAGVSDMKGGIVIMVNALAQVLAEGLPDDAAVLLLINGAEETAAADFPPFIRGECRNARCCLNFEPGNLAEDGAFQLATARKGIARFDLNIRGKSAHAGNSHEEGVSAVRELARKIEALEEETDYAAGITVNVGPISGGLVPNQVPDWATAGFEVRFCQPDDGERLRRTVTEICKEPTLQSVRGNVRCEIELHERSGFPAFPHHPKNDALLQKYDAISRQLTGRPARGILRGGASDSNFVADQVPVLDGLGMIGGGYHSDEEWGNAMLVNDRVAIAAELIRQLLH